MSIGRIEYRVREVTRFVVTRHEQDAEGVSLGSQERGEYDNRDVAFDVGVALAVSERISLGLEPGDERMQYPKRETDALAA